MLCLLVPLTRRDAPLPLTVDCGWAPSTFPCGRSDRTQVLRGNSSCTVTWCPVLRGTGCPRTQKYAEVVFQKTFSSLPRGQGLAPEPKVCIVFLPQGLATNSVWHLYLQHHRVKQIIWLQPGRPPPPPSHVVHCMGRAQPGQPFPPSDGHQKGVYMPPPGAQVLRRLLNTALFFCLSFIKFKVNGAY